MRKPSLGSDQWIVTLLQVHTCIASKDTLLFCLNIAVMTETKINKTKINEKVI